MSKHQHSYFITGIECYLEGSRYYTNMIYGAIRVATGSSNWEAKLLFSWEYSCILQKFHTQGHAYQITLQFEGENLRCKETHRGSADTVSMFIVSFEGYRNS